MIQMCVLTSSFFLVLFPGNRPSRFLVLSKNQPNSLVTIDNLTWTTFAVYIKAPKWINCQRKFMLEAKSNAEFEVFSNLTKAQSTSQSLNDKVKFTFIDMSNKDVIYTSKSVVFFVLYYFLCEQFFFVLMAVSD